MVSQTGKPPAFENIIVTPGKSKDIFFFTSLVMKALVL